MSTNFDTGSTAVGTPAIDSGNAANSGSPAPQSAATQLVTGSASTANAVGASASDAWYSSFKNDELRGYAETRNWKDPEQAIESYRNLEKMLGADKAGRGLVIPANDEDTEGWSQVYTKLGKPESPSDYKLAVPEGSPPEFAQKASEWMHGAGLNTKQAQALGQKWNEYINNQMQSQQLEAAQREDRELAEIQKEWGSDYDKKLEISRRTARMFGIDEAKAAKLTAGFGVKETYNLLAQIGASFSEDKFVSSGGPTGPMSTEAARVRQSELIKDKAWSVRFDSGDVLARQEWDNLNRIIASTPKNR